MRAGLSPAGARAGSAARFPGCPRVEVELRGHAAIELPGRRGVDGGIHDTDGQVLIPGRISRQAASLEAQPAARLRAGRDPDLDLGSQRRHLYLGAERGLPGSQGEFEVDVLALEPEQRVRPDPDGQTDVARAAIGEPDLLAIGDARGNAHVEGARLNTQRPAGVGDGSVDGDRPRRTAPGLLQLDLDFAGMLRSGPVKRLFEAEAASPA